MAFSYKFEEVHKILSKAYKWSRYVKSDTNGTAIHNTFKHLEFASMLADSDQHIGGCLPSVNKFKGMFSINNLNLSKGFFLISKHL